MEVDFCPFFWLTNFLQFFSALALFATLAVVIAEAPAPVPPSPRDVSDFELEARSPAPVPDFGLEFEARELVSLPNASVTRFLGFSVAIARSTPIARPRTSSNARPAALPVTLGFAPAARLVASSAVKQFYDRNKSQDMYSNRFDFERRRIVLQPASILYSSKLGVLLWSVLLPSFFLYALLTLLSLSHAPRILVSLRFWAASFSLSLLTRFRLSPFSAWVFGGGAEDGEEEDDDDEKWASLFSPQEEPTPLSSAFEIGEKSKRDFLWTQKAEKISLPTLHHPIIDHHWHSSPSVRRILHSFSGVAWVNQAVEFWKLCKEIRLLEDETMDIVVEGRGTQSLDR
ncbi:hypothetical protein C8J56DRAFT_1128740 [Mycena floridula]|nr:hypothetical protein C8J56DRAFT_1128740 [Mycena floridula]